MTHTTGLVYRAHRETTPSSLGSRLVLIEQDEAAARRADPHHRRLNTPRVVRARLLSNEIEMATDEDLLLPADPPARPHQLLVHPFPVYLDPADLAAPLYTSDPTTLRPILAPPLTSSDDPRWRWKLRELEAAHALQPPLSVILGEEPSGCSA